MAISVAALGALAFASPASADQHMPTPNAATSTTAGPTPLDVIVAGISPGGEAQFNQDPVGSVPGDAVRACDTAADGFGIEARLDIGRNGTIDRIATTRGHASPFCSDWVPGNIAEGTPVSITACLVQGTTTSCRITVNTTA